jgi:WD40 repeat protein
MKIKYILLVLILFMPFLQAKEIKPLYKLTASGMVVDLLVDEGKLYASTDVGIVDIFDIATRKAIGKITLPGTKDFLGDIEPPKIYSIDKFGDKLLMVSQGEHGFRDVYIYDGKELKRIIDSSKEFFIKKGLFVDENRILLGQLSSVIILYDISKNSIIYKHAIKERRSGGSAFSDMVLSEDRKTVATADESGEVHLFNVDDFKHIKLYEGQNLDNIYKIDYKKGIVITAGQDRRCAIYKPNGTAYYLPGEFLIYAAGLSPSGKIGIFAATIDNDLQAFNTDSKGKIALLKGHNATLTDFAFIGETEFFSSADERNILFWEIKQ